MLLLFFVSFSFANVNLAGIALELIHYQTSNFF
jgi:hypothetical protein